jgi:thioredoxin 1
MFNSILQSLFKSSFKTIAPTDLAVFLKENPGTQLIDVRGVDESRAAGTIPGAKVAPLNSPTLDKLVKNLDKSKPVVVFCRSGMRSRMACDYISKQGITELYNLSGGHMAWLSAQG